MTLRLAATADLPDLVHLEQVCFGAHAWSTNALRAEFDRGFVLLTTPTPVGYIIGLPIVDVCELLRVGVHPDARRQGVGRQLLDRFHAEARERGAVRSLLEVRADNTTAIRLYTRDGYTQDGRRKGYYADGNVDALLFSRPLH